MKKILAVDLFCGAGGASQGFVRACEALALEYLLLAVNHWNVAIWTHSTNHPLRCKRCAWTTHEFPSPRVCPTCLTGKNLVGVRHLCMAVDQVDPLQEIPGGRLHILMAGPECTHFSPARGGRPVNPQSRASAWHILKWHQELYIDHTIIENVPAFKKWGPIGANGKPLKSKECETFEAFLVALRSLGNKVEVRELVAADYGDATTRKRLFIRAKRSKGPVEWPMPTHSKDGGASLFGPTKRWVAAREVIDWSIKGKSIFQRKTPLKPATMARILAGLEKFGGPTLQPFLVVLRNNQTAQSIDGPVPTLTTSGANVGLAEPFIVANNTNNAPRSVDEPVPTITTGARNYVVEPCILPQGGGGALRPSTEPLPTIATDGAIGVVEPYLIPFLGERKGQAPRVRSVDEPMQTVTGSNPIGVAEPFLIPYYTERPNERHARTRSVDEPLPAITASGSGKVGVIESFIITPGGANLRQPSATSNPLPTITASDRFGVVESVIVQTNERRAERTQSVDQPLRTITAQGGRCFGLAEPVIIDAAFGEGNETRRAKSLDDPLGAITGSNRFALAEPVLMHITHGGDKNRARSVDDPVPTVTGAKRGELALAEPFITKYNRTAIGAYSIDEPVDTISTRDRFGLVQPVINGYALDIRFRMLQPHELAAATSFPKSFVFQGTREDVVKQIGNAWPGELSMALNFAVLTTYAKRRRHEPWREEATA